MKVTRVGLWAGGVVVGGVVATVLAYGVSVGVSKPGGFTPTEFFKWGKNVTSTQGTVVPVTGKTYALKENFDITQKMRFGSTALPSGWHLVEDSGSGSESAIYDITYDDKKTTIKTANSASSASQLYNDLKQCSDYWVSRMTSSTFLEQYKKAAPGTTQANQETAYVFMTDNGDGVEFARVDYIYKDTAGTTIYGTALYRCGKTNVMSVSVTSSESEVTKNKAVNEVLSQMIIKGAKQ